MQHHEHRREPPAEPGYPEHPEVTHPGHMPGSTTDAAQDYTAMGHASDRAHR